MLPLKSWVTVAEADICSQSCSQAIARNHYLTVIVTVLKLLIANLWRYFLQQPLRNQGCLDFQWPVVANSCFIPTANYSELLLFNFSQLLSIENCCFLTSANCWQLFLFNFSQLLRTVGEIVAKSCICTTQLKVARLKVIIALTISIIIVLIIVIMDIFMMIVNCFTFLRWENCIQLCRLRKDWLEVLPGLLLLSSKLPRLRMI